MCFVQSIIETNPVINLALIVSIRKSDTITEFAHNEPLRPVICFAASSGWTVFWQFPTETERDEAYDEIMKSLF
jgi:hypothetical protein